VNRTPIQLYARIAGILFLASFVGGGFGEFLAPSQIVAPGDAVRIPTVFAVLALTVWWLFKGVHVSRWDSRANQLVPASVT
jgi:hypothetical protein